MKNTKINSELFFKDIRKETNEPLVRICKLMGINSSTLFNSVRRGNINFQTFKTLCDAFDLKQEKYLIADDEEKNIIETKSDKGYDDIKEIKDLLTSMNDEHTKMNMELIDLLTNINKVLMDLTYGTNK